MYYRKLPKVTSPQKQRSTESNVKNLWPLIILKAGSESSESSEPALNHPTPPPKIVRHKVQFIFSINTQVKFTYGVLT